jgi:dTDP-4-amino-4,6-dideoxygalactose transaminase
MKKIKFLDLVAQYNSIKNEINEAIINVINDSAFIGGKYVETFEKAFAEYHQAKYCIGVGNGTDAIEIALESLDLPKGGEVIVPANTFIATAEAVTRSGYKVVFCDCNSDDYTISIESFQSKITNRTVAVIPVHLYGHPCDMDRIMELSSKYNIKVIEDCAQAHEQNIKILELVLLGILEHSVFILGKTLVLMEMQVQ